MSMLFKWLSDCISGPGDAESDECHLLRSFFLETSDVESPGVRFMPDSAAPRPHYAETFDCAGFTSESLLMQNTPTNVITVAPRPISSDVEFSGDDTMPLHGIGLLSDRVSSSSQGNLMPLHETGLLSGLAPLSIKCPAAEKIPCESNMDEVYMHSEDAVCCDAPEGEVHNENCLISRPSYKHGGGNGGGLSHKVFNSQALKNVNFRDGVAEKISSDSGMDGVYVPMQRGDVICCDKLKGEAHSGELNDSRPCYGGEDGGGMSHMAFDSQAFKNIDFRDGAGGTVHSEKQYKAEKWHNCCGDMSLHDKTSMQLPEQAVDRFCCRADKPKRKVKLPEPYDGSSNPVSFLKQFETLSTLNEWSSAEMAMQLFACMKGPALDLLAEVNFTQQKCYAELKQALINRFDWQNSSDRCKARLRVRRRGLNEPLVELFYDVKKLVRTAFGDESVMHGSDDPMQLLHGEAIEYFLEAVGNKDMEFMIRLSKPKTIDDAYHLAQSYENISLIHPQGRPAIFRRSDGVGSELPPQKADIVCNKCGAAGHKVWFCPQINCHGCGAYGHTRRDCAKMNKRT